MDKLPLQFRIAARILLVNEENKLLLVANSKSQIWFTPGGRVEPNETLEQAAIRETFEETGITIENPKLVYVREAIDTKSEKPQHHVCFYFFARTEASLPEQWQDHDGYIDLNRFFTQQEIQELKDLWPPILKDQFWQDLENDFKDIDPYAYYVMT